MVFGGKLNVAGLFGKTFFDIFFSENIDEMNRKFSSTIILNNCLNYKF